MNNIIPNDMNVPILRRDLVNGLIPSMDPSGIDSRQNIKWLLRNLAIHNSNHPKLDSVLDKLKNLLPNESPFVLNRLKNKK